MRLDKFLKLSRLVKRRAVAQEMAEIGAVRLNGRQSKPAAEVRGGDTIEVAYPRRVLKVRVECADEQALRRGAPCYAIIDERQVRQDEKPW